MRKSKILSLLLATVTAAGLYTASMIPVAADENDSGPNRSGMVINKTATVNTAGGFDITLEAYATGSKVTTSVNKDVPTDIVLVIDQSGSMKYCIGCGKEILTNGNKKSKHDTYKYTEITDLNNSSRYYVKSGNTYIEVKYCNGEHKNGGPNSTLTRCDGGAGWYPAQESSGPTDQGGNQSAAAHTAEAKITPKTSSNSNGTQFYTRNWTGTEDCTSRLDSIKTAATTFVNSVNEKAKGADGQYGTEDDVNHRIAIVGFASESGYGNNTELLSISGSNSSYNSGSIGVKYDSSLSSEKYENVLQDMDTIEGANMVNNAISALTANGATRTDLGLTMADKIFENNHIGESEERNRVVIVFSDGAPTGLSGFNKSVADYAISKANSIKTEYGAKVYAVGVFAGADHASAGTEPSDDLNQNSTSMNSACNWFMQNVSSNNGTVQTPSYYLSAGDSGSLNNIFQSIADEIESGGSSTTLGSETVIKDIIAPQFELPANATASDIALETYACTGVNAAGEYTWSKNEDSMGARATVNGDKVDVTGFDFSTNWCGTETTNGDTTYRGNKLVIKFTVQTKDGFLGGNDVFTNTSAGVYENATAETAVQEFPKPTVNVPIQDVTVTAEDKNVYLLGDLTAEQIKSGATVKCGTVELNLAADNYGLESWQYAYVDIEIKYTDASGSTITDLSQLKDDTTYTVSATVKPISDGVTANADGITAVGTPNEMDGESGNGNGNINVFKPELTFKDSTVYNGNPVPTDDDYKSNNYDSTVWKHKATDGTETTANPDNMIGIAPELTFTYTPDASQIDGDKIDATSDKIGVAVLVKIGETDITDKVYGFKHIICTDVEGCAHPDGNYKFWLHILSTDLIIKKTVDEIVEGQSFLFTITLEDGTKLKVEIGSDDFNGKTATVTIKDLKVGQEYTVTEDTSWSWRYTIVGNSTVTKALSANKADNVFAFENKLKPEKWLGEETFVENYWKDKVTIVKDNDLPWKKSN